jgi:hypothetical protein
MKGPAKIRIIPKTCTLRHHQQHLNSSNALKASTLNRYDFERKIPDKHNQHDIKSTTTNNSDNINRTLYTTVLNTLNLQPNSKPFELTTRVEVNLPFNQKTVVRINPHISLEELMNVICKEALLDKSKYSLIIQTTTNDQIIDYNMKESFSIYKTNQVSLKLNNNNENKTLNRSYFTQKDQTGSKVTKHNINKQLTKNDRSQSEMSLNSVNPNELSDSFDSAKSGSMSRNNNQNSSNKNIKTSTSSSSSSSVLAFFTRNKKSNTKMSKSRYSMYSINDNINDQQSEESLKLSKKAESTLTLDNCYKNENRKMSMDSKSQHSLFKSKKKAPPPPPPLLHQTSTVTLRRDSNTDFKKKKIAPPPPQPQTPKIPREESMEMIRNSSPISSNNNSNDSQDSQVFEDDLTSTKMYQASIPSPKLEILNEFNKRDMARSLVIPVIEKNIADFHKKNKQQLSMTNAIKKEEEEEEIKIEIKSPTSDGELNNNLLSKKDDIEDETNLKSSDNSNDNSVIIKEISDQQNTDTDTDIDSDNDENLVDLNNNNKDKFENANDDNDDSIKAINYKPLFSDNLKHNHQFMNYLPPPQQQKIHEYSVAEQTGIFFKVSQQNESKFFKLFKIFNKDNDNSLSEIDSLKEPELISPNTSLESTNFSTNQNSTPKKLTRLLTVSTTVVTAILPENENNKITIISPVTTFNANHNINNNNKQFNAAKIPPSLLPRPFKVFNQNNNNKSKISTLQQSFPAIAETQKQEQHPNYTVQRTGDIIEKNGTYYSNDGTVRGYSGTVKKMANSSSLNEILINKQKEIENNEEEKKTIDQKPFEYQIKHNSKTLQPTNSSLSSNSNIFKTGNLKSPTFDNKLIKHNKDNIKNDSGISDELSKKLENRRRSIGEGSIMQTTSDQSLIVDINNNTSLDEPISSSAASTVGSISSTSGASSVSTHSNELLAKKTTSNYSKSNSYTFKMIPKLPRDENNSSYVKRMTLFNELKSVVPLKEPELELNNKVSSPPPPPPPQQQQQQQQGPVVSEKNFSTNAKKSINSINRIMDQRDNLLDSIKLFSVSNLKKTNRDI